MNGGKLIIENTDGNYGYGTLKFAENARINLEGSNALVDVNGRIEIGDNAVFRLSSQNNINKTYGQIKFHGGFGNDVMITAGSNASIDIQGYAKNQLVITNSNSNLEFPDNLIALNLKNMQIIQSNGCRIITPFSNDCDIVFDNVDISKTPSAISHAGIKLYGQAHVNITNCSVSDGSYGISSDNFELGHSLSVKKTVFSNCQQAIVTNGKGVNLTEVTFDQCHKGLVAINTSSTSNIYKCEATNTVSSNITYEGATTLFVERSKFYDALHGISVEQATLKAKCNDIHDHSGYAIKGSMNATLLLGQSYSNNRLNGNTRTIELDQVNSLDLYLGENDLRPITQGTQNIINGSLICSSLTTIDARKNKWKTGGGGPNSTDYSVYRSCSGFPSVTYTDFMPQSNLAVCPPITVPNGLAGKNGSSSNDETNQYNDDLNNTIYGMADDVLLDLVQMLRSHDIYDYINSSLTESNSTLVSISEITNSKLATFNALSEMIISPVISEEISNLSYKEGIAELFSTFVELNSIPDTFPELIDTELEQIFNNTLAVLDMGIENFADNADYLFGLHLSKAQAYRIGGQYELAIAEISVAASLAANTSQIALTEKLDCLFNAESIMTANPGKDEWPEEYIFCQYTNQGGELKLQQEQIQPKAQQATMVEITAIPNPTSNNIVIDANNTTSGIKHVAVYDTFGRKVIDQKSNNPNRIQMSGLTNGIYFIQILFEDGTVGQTRVLKSE